MAIYCLRFTILLFTRYLRNQREITCKSNKNWGKNMALRGQSTAIPAYSSPISADMFPFFPADVFQNVSTSLSNHEHNFYCPQLWVIQLTVMGCTTHSYGLYNPQLWVVEFVLTIGKTSAHVGENICSRWGKYPGMNGDACTFTLFSVSTQLPLPPNKTSRAAVVPGLSCHERVFPLVYHSFIIRLVSVPSGVSTLRRYAPAGRRSRSRRCEAAPFTASSSTSAPVNE